MLLNRLLNGSAKGSYPDKYSCINESKTLNMSLSDFSFCDVKPSSIYEYR